MHSLTSKRAVIKTDSGYVNNIKNGLLSIDIWRDRIQEIVSGRIGEFALSPEQEANFKKVISSVLETFLAEADTLLQKRRKTLSEAIQKMVVSTFFDTSDLRKKVPQLTQTIVNEIKKPANSARLKEVAKSQLEDYSEKSFDKARDPSPLNRTLAKYQASTSAEFNQKTQGPIRSLERRSAVYSGIMLGSLFLFLGTWWRERKNASAQKLIFTFGVAFAAVFLLTAVATPMMEIDARITKVDFVLLGKHLVFQDQVVFYRSKSILQVVHTMLKMGDFGSVVVGMLIFAFSILFPIAKLTSAEAYLLGSEKIRSHKAVQFFAFYSGKWSMADVMVLSIFMAFIGFKGILESELKSLNFKTESLECISTSGTSLQPGCMLFVAFVLFGLFLSVMLKRISRSNATVQMTQEKIEVLMEAHN